jgi:hypothetical protein
LLGDEAEGYAVASIHAQPCRVFLRWTQGHSMGSLGQGAESMGVQDQAKNQAEELKGQAKEGFGK